VISTVNIRSSDQGFTLLELIVVGVLIGLMLAVTIPNIQSLLVNDPLKKSARLIVAAMTEAKRKGMGSEKGAILAVDMAANKLVIRSGAKKQDQSGTKSADSRTVKLADSVSIISIWTQVSEHRSDTIISLWVNRRGMIEPVIINVSDGERVMGLKSSPFLADIEVVDRELSPSARLFAQSTLNQ